MGLLEVGDIEKTTITDLQLPRFWIYSAKYLGNHVFNVLT